MIETRGELLRIPLWIQKDTPHTGSLILPGNISVIKERPVIQGGIIYPHNIPYVFWVDELVDENRNRSFFNLMVMLGHGMVRNGIRIFGNGQPIRKTLEAYQQFAKTHTLDRIGAVLACDIPRRTKTSTFPVPLFTAHGPIHIRNVPSKDRGIAIILTTEGTLMEQ